MHKINVEIIIKILILSSFSLFFYYLIQSGKIFLYVHPRIISFIILGIIVMVLIVFFMVNDAIVREKIIKKKKKIRFNNYITFIMPLTLIFFMEISNTKINDMKLSNRTSKFEQQEANVKEYENKKNNKDEEITIIENKLIDIKTNKLEISENTINITASNFVFSLCEILDDPDKYIGYDVNITGFVYKDDGFKENEFVIGRYIMVCCAADMQVTGIICTSNEAKNYDNDTWIKIKGKLTKEKYKDIEQVVIAVYNIEEDKNPDTSYVYPY